MNALQSMRSLPLIDIANFSSSIVLQYCIKFAALFRKNATITDAQHYQYLSVFIEADSMKIQSQTRKSSSWLKSSEKALKVFSTKNSPAGKERSLNLSASLGCFFLSQYSSKIMSYFILLFISSCCSNSTDGFWESYRIYWETEDTLPLLFVVSPLRSWS